jgi:hypothetical protein
VDQLYAFFVQWKPELYGDDEEISAERRGFVVLDGDEREEPEEMEVFEEYFNDGITALQKDWEVWSACLMLFYVPIKYLESFIHIKMSPLPVKGWEI